MEESEVGSKRRGFNGVDEPPRPLSFLSSGTNQRGVTICGLRNADRRHGHFYLTSLLLEKMKITARKTGIEGRIVNLSYVAHIYTYKGRIRFNELNDKHGYSDKKAYGQSKLANILHAYELSRRLQAEMKIVIIASFMP
ncbi:short-chain dehydrogenase TIC 32, chloroplastic isoform X1 [Canna indica]|uniref:Short-chain dehydrogenase TIC 32, chloroplastic isoform X1 n=1 Tax=Canna indica TaxID=4628 RepID=A0AAQ3KWA4_9LILI|nr:short-chain dehydrogenase TIC 32, chloroplastic isoform X1 [Canna indica]